MKFIQEILERAAKIQPQDDALVHNIEPEDGDRPLGELPMELRGLFAVLREEGEKTKEVLTQVTGELKQLAEKVSDKTIGQLQEEAKAIKAKLDIPSLNHSTVNNMFWSAVRRAIPGAVSENSIAIRAGWQIVACEPDEPEISGIAIPMSLLPELLGRRP